jgi:hypothetical protein
MHYEFLRDTFTYLPYFLLQLKGHKNNATRKRMETSESTAKPKRLV